MKNSNKPKEPRETVELKEVVKQTISSIAAAIVELSQDEEFIKTSCVVSPGSGELRSNGKSDFWVYKDTKSAHGERRVHDVEFRLAITQTKHATKGGGIGISVVDLGLKHGEEIGVTNTVSFSIPVVWPVGDR